MTIPVVHSVPSGAALIETVRHDYPISHPLSCKLYKRRLENVLTDE